MTKLNIRTAFAKNEPCKIEAFFEDTQAWEVISSSSHHRNNAEVAMSQFQSDMDFQEDYYTGGYYTGVRIRWEK